MKLKKHSPTISVIVTSKQGTFVVYCEYYSENVFSEPPLPYKVVLDSTIKSINLEYWFLHHTNPL